MERRRVHWKIEDERGDESEKDTPMGDIWAKSFTLEMDRVDALVGVEESLLEGGSVSGDDDDTTAVGQELIID